MVARGIRNNNFGNIEDGPFAQSLPGYTGTDGRFATFATPQDGVAAMDRLLSGYGRKGFNTVDGIINRWAPASDGNPVSEYANSVAQKTGYGIGQQVDMNDPAVRRAIAQAMAEFETGSPMSSYFAEEASKKMTPMQYAMAPTPDQVFAPGKVKPVTEAPPSLSSQFITDGPGVLFSQPGGWGRNASYDLPTAMERAGLYLRDDAAALGGLKYAGGDQDQYSTSYDPASGTVFRLDKKKGTVQATRNPNWTGEKVDPTVLKSLSEDWSTKYGALHNAAERAKYFKDKIDSGELDLGVYSQWIKNPMANILGVDDGKKQLLNEFQAFRTELANAGLRLNAGVQTEGDAQRAFNEFAPGTSQYDNKSVSRSLDNIISKTGKVMNEGAKSQLEGYSRSYPNKPEVFQPFYDRLSTQSRFYKDYEAAKAKPVQGTRPPLDTFIR